MNYCSLCHQKLFSKATETWRLDDISISLPVDDVISILIAKEGEDIRICELCFEQEQFRDFSGEEIAEIGYQFSLEFQNRGMYQKALEACVKTFKRFKASDLINSAAGIIAIQNVRDATILYRAVLLIDPENALAKANLTILLNRDK
jgi:hypothetical protein